MEGSQRTNYHSIYVTNMKFFLFRINKILLKWNVLLFLLKISIYTSREICDRRWISNAENMPTQKMYQRNNEAGMIKDFAPRMLIIIGKWFCFLSYPGKVQAGSALLPLFGKFPKPNSQNSYPNFLFPKTKSPIPNIFWLKTLVI